MIIIIEQMGLLFAFMCLGFLFGKKRIVDAQHSKLISALCVNLFMPCTVFNAFYNNFNSSYLSKYFPFILVSACFMCVLLIVGFFAARRLTDNEYERKVYRYSFIVPNYAYMGYALAEGIYGGEGLLNIVIFAIPIMLYIYTYGYCVLTKRGLSLKKLANPVIIAMLIGAIVGLTQLRLPNSVMGFVNKASGCMAPLSMLLAGITISEYKLKNLLSDKKAYLMATIRLIVIPLCVLLVLKPFCSIELTRTAVLLFSMPFGLNPIIFAKLVDENYFLPAKLAFISSVFSIITVPLFLSVF